MVSTIVFSQCQGLRETPWCSANQNNGSCFLVMPVTHAKPRVCSTPETHQFGFSPTLNSAVWSSVVPKPDILRTSAATSEKLEECFYCRYLGDLSKIPEHYELDQDDGPQLIATTETRLNSDIPKLHTSLEGQTSKPITAF